jgi:hypothetical protein
MLPILPPSKPDFVAYDDSHNDSFDVDRDEKVRLRTSLMAPTENAEGGFQWLAVGQCVAVLPAHYGLTLGTSAVEHAARSSLSRPASPLIAPRQAALTTSPPSDADVPDLVPSYANSAPSEEEDFEFYEEPPSSGTFPTGDLLVERVLTPATPSSSGYLEKPRYQPDAALIDEVEDPFQDLREAVRVMTGKSREAAEAELRNYEVEQDMTARLQEAMW